MMREENDDAARVLAEAGKLVEHLHDPHDLGHVDQGLALLAVSQGEVEAAGRSWTMCRGAFSPWEPPRRLAYKLGPTSLTPSGRGTSSQPTTLSSIALPDPPKET